MFRKPSVVLKIVFLNDGVTKKGSKLNQKIDVSKIDPKKKKYTTWYFLTDDPSIKELWIWEI
jgi:hypothetical protein